MNPKINKVVLYIISIITFVVTSVFLCKMDFKNASSLELGLLYLLQFFASFTLVFMYSRDTTIKEFKRDNKRFAESSYERINEIDNAVKELEKHLVSKKGRSEVYEETKLSFSQLKQTISASKHDWELFFYESTKQETEYITKKENPKVMSSLKEEPNVSDQKKTVIKKPETSSLNLISIPDYSKVVSDKSKFMAKYISDIITSTGHFDIKCFLDEDNQKDVKISDVLKFEFRPFDSDSGPLWLLDQNMIRIGGLLNDKQQSYDDYANALLLINSLFQIEMTIITNVKEEYDENDQEMYKVFTSRIKYM